MLAEAKTADQAASGLAEAQVQEAKATSKEKDGYAEAAVLQRTAEAEALGLVAMADGIEKEGTAEAEVMRLKYSSEAQGIEEKANAMKLFDDVGKDHEEFKIRLNKDKDIEIAAIDAQRLIAEAQADIMGEALKNMDSIKNPYDVTEVTDNGGFVTQTTLAVVKDGKIVRESLE